MIGYTVSIEGLAELEMDLGMSRDKTKYILRAAINNTAKIVERQMASKAKDRYTLQGGYRSYRAVNKIEKAKVNRLYATIIAKSGPKDTLKYTVKPETYYPGSVGAPDYIKAKTLKGKRIKKMGLRLGSGGDEYRAFVVRYTNQSKSGATSEHYAFAERVPGSHMREKPWKEALRSLYSTTEAKGEEVVYKQKIDNTVYGTLSEEIRKAIPKYVK